MLQNMNSRDWKQTYVNAAVGRYRVSLMGAFGTIVLSAVLVLLAYLYMLLIGVPLWVGITVVLFFACVSFFIGYILAIFAEVIWKNGLEVQTLTTILLTLSFMAAHLFYLRSIY